MVNDMPGGYKIPMVSIPKGGRTRDIKGLKMTTWKHDGC